MHEVDETTEQMVRSVLAYAENRLRMNPVPLDKGFLPAAELYERLDGLIRETPRQPDEVLGGVHLGDRPECALRRQPTIPRLHPGRSDQGQPAVRHAGVLCLDPRHLLAGGVRSDRRGEQRAANDRPRGGPTADVGGLLRLRRLRGKPVCSRGRPRDGQEAGRGTGRRFRVVGRNRCPLLDREHAAAVGDGRPGGRDSGPPPHRRHRPRAVPEDTTNIAAVVCTSGTTNAGIIDDLAGVGAIARERGWWFHVDGAYGGSGMFARSLRPKYDGLEQADSFILDPHKWLFTPFDCCALLYRQPELARAAHTQDAAYLDVIHATDGEWNPSDYAYHLTRRARGLPLWFSLAVYGLEAYRQAIEVAASLAKQTAELIKAAPQLELIREPDLGVVLFRRLGWKSEDYDAWAQRLHRDQVAFIPPTKWEGETVGRFAFLHPDTSLELVREVLARTE